MIFPLRVSVPPSRNVLEDDFWAELLRLSGCDMSSESKGASRIIDSDQGLPLLNRKRFIFRYTQSDCLYLSRS